MKLSERHKIIFKDNVEILEVDLSSASEEDYLKLTDLVVDYSMSKHPQRPYMLLNINKTLFSPRIMEAGKKNVMRTEHIESTVALYNSNDLYRLLVRIVTHFSSKKTFMFKTREQALAFLVETAKSHNRVSGSSLSSSKNSLLML